MKGRARPWEMKSGWKGAEGLRCQQGEKQEQEVVGGKARGSGTGHSANEPTPQRYQETAKIFIIIID